MYSIKGQNIFVSKEDFNIEHILFCGQIFSYKNKTNSYLVQSGSHIAEVFEEKDCYKIITNDTDFFVKFFDLDRDYQKIKKVLSKEKILVEPIKFGYGIRILQNDKFEMLISFIISANNNIKRIQKIINALRERVGRKVGEHYAFPSREELLSLSEQDFASIGAGYRAKYLYKVLRQVDEKTLENWGNLETKELRQNLLNLAGVGPKVADCILLFGFNKQDVFPVDTWIEQMYNEFINPNEHNRLKIRDDLVSRFGEYAGYAQQYLFYYQRSGKKD